MNTGLIFQDNPLFFLKRIFMLESQKMLPSRQQAFCFFACLPEREHITLILKQMRQPLLFYQFFYHAARKSGSLERDSHFKALHIRLFFLFLDSDMQVCELHRVDDIGSAAHKVGCILVLGEGDDFTDAVGAGQQHDKTVYAVGQSCVRRNAVLEGREQETEFFIGFLFGEADDLKHLLLDVALVDTDTAAAEFDAVEDNVVCFRTDAAGICIDAFPILFHRHGERMVHGYITVFLLGPLKKREVHDPEEIELVVVDEAKILAQFQAQSTQDVPDDTVFVRSEEEKVACLTAHAADQRLNLLLGDKFCKGALDGPVLL